MTQPFNRVLACPLDIALTAIDLAGDIFNVMFTPTLPLITQIVYGDVSPSELPQANGYMTGGFALNGANTDIGGVFTRFANDFSFRALGPVGPFRYVVLYSQNVSILQKPLLGWWDFGSQLTLVEGETFSIGFDPINGLLNLQ
jgi:hypothetical protein